MVPRGSPNAICEAQPCTAPRTVQCTVPGPCSDRAILNSSATSSKRSGPADQHGYRLGGEPPTPVLDAASSTGSRASTPVSRRESESPAPRRETGSGSSLLSVPWGCRWPGLADGDAPASGDDPDRCVMRRNPCTGEWVLYVTPSESCTKPRDYPSKSTRSRLRAHERAEHDSSCPFCPGNEHLCNGDIFALRNGAGEWTARLFENKFPILHAHGTGRVIPSTDAALDERVRAAARLEVLVASRRHNECNALQSGAVVGEMLALLQSRALELVRGPEGKFTRHFAMFCNHGPRAGGSLQHPHWQMAACQFTPPELLTGIEVHQRHLEEQSSCVQCAHLAQLLSEPAEASRIVLHNEQFVALCPVAAGGPTVWIVPRRCSPSFLEAREDELQALGSALQQVSAKIYNAYSDPDYNFSIRTTPGSVGGDEQGPFHWYVAVVAHIFEDCSLGKCQFGMAISGLLPEAVAAALREAPDVVEDRSRPSQSAIRRP